MLLEWEVGWLINGVDTWLKRYELGIVRGLGACVVRSGMVGEVGTKALAKEWVM